MCSNSFVFIVQEMSAGILINGRRLKVDSGVEFREFRANGRERMHPSVGKVERMYFASAGDINVLVVRVSVLRMVRMVGTVPHVRRGRVVRSVYVPSNHMLWRVGFGPTLDDGDADTEAVVRIAPMQV
jgi:hypothetical protein